MIAIVTLTEAEVERFWRYVAHAAPVDACWPWLRGRQPAPKAYGIFTAQGRSLRAHRVAFSLHHGIALTLGVVVRHVVCHNPPCCNPHHLDLGSVVDNNEDRTAAQRSARGQYNGASKLCPEQVLEIRARARAGESASKVLAPEFGVSATAIRLIRSGRTWAHVVDDDTREDLEVLTPEQVIAQMMEPE